MILFSCKVVMNVKMIHFSIHPNNKLLLGLLSVAEEGLLGYQEVTILLKPEGGRYHIHPATAIGKVDRLLGGAVVTARRGGSGWTLWGNRQRQHSSRL